MQLRVHTWLADAALMLLSVAATLLALEHVVFRYILVPDDLLPNVTIGGVVRYQPDTRAVFRQADGSETLVTVNSDGWNSTKPRYSQLRSPDRQRIAVIGDSYVHGTFVDVDRGFPELLEQRLKRHGIEADVYRFGMDGAPLSQYLHMLRHEVLKFRPDVVVIPLIHNDFDESYRLLKTRYGSSFLKITQDAEGRFVEIPPTDFKPGFADRMRNWRTFRYLYYETNLYLHLKGWISRLFWGGDDDWQPEFVSSAVDIRKVNDHRRNKQVARYILQQMQALAVREGFRLAFVMDGVREAIYEGRSPMDYEVGRLNRIAAELTGELGLPFLDLQETFARDFAVHRKRFEFDYDWHWNERGNALVAAAIADLLLADPRLFGEPPRRPAAPAQPQVKSGSARKI